jgi:hypothetical protein
VHYVLYKLLKVGRISSKVDNEKRKGKKRKGKEKERQIHQYQEAEVKKRGLPVCLKGIGNCSSALLCSLIKEEE